jgi:prevent-host-death family protein
MDKMIQVAEASKYFSDLLREVQEGQSYVVTSDGRPVARIVPVAPIEPARLEARKRLLERLRSQPAIDIGPWTRDELYER